MILTPITLIWNLLHFMRRNSKIISVTIPLVSLIGLLVVGPSKIAFASSAWKTQEIVYQNGHSHFKTVEFQMQDVGALGYNKRTVEVMHLTDLFMIVGPVDENIEERIEWVKVNIKVNELGLKYP